MFKQYLNEKTIIEQDLMLMVYSMEQYDLMNEGQERLDEMSINDFLGKFGLKFHKEGPGLIDYVKDFAKGIGKIFTAAVKGDKAEVKRIATSITKEQVMDFLLKLDQATLHIITGPIHFVDAITGWDLWADIEKITKKGKDLLSDIWKALTELKNKVKKAFDPQRLTSLLAQITALEDMIPKPKVVPVK